MPVINADEKQKKEKAQEKAAVGPKADSAADKTENSGLKGLENFGAETPAQGAEPEERPFRKSEGMMKKKTDPEIEKLRKQLERQKESIKAAEVERGDALKKSEELADLVEELSDEIKEVRTSPLSAQVQAAVPNLEPKLREIEEKMASQAKELKEALENAMTKKEEENKGEAEVAETMKRMFDKRLKELTEKLEETRPAPAPREEAARIGEVSGGLMSMGGAIELQKELDKVKKSLKDMATLLDAFKEEAENRFMAIDRELETVERLPSLEDKMDQFERKLGSENVQKLRMLISSADDLREEVIPTVVKRAVADKIEPHEKRVKNVEDSLQKANEKMNLIITDIGAVSRDIKALYKFDDRIAKLEEGMAGAKKLIAELRTLIRDFDKEQRKDAEDRMREILPKMIEAESSSVRKEFAGRFAFIDGKIQSVENMVAESHNEISKLSVLHGEFDDLSDKLARLNEEKEKIRDRIEALKAKDMDIMDEIEALQTPKEVITELDNKTKDILEIREFFVRRVDGLEQRIKDLDERAVPTKKLHDRVVLMVNEIKALHDAQKKLEEKTEAEKREFHDLIKQHTEDKKKLEEKLREQRVRISTLLHELK